jgi:hypothetical protein
MENIGNTKHFFRKSKQMTTTTKTQMTIIPAVASNRDEFTLTKGDRVVIEDGWNYHLATVVGFGKESVKVKPDHHIERNPAMSFDEYGYQYGTRGNYGYTLRTLEEAMPKVIAALATRDKLMREAQQNPVRFV